MLLLLRKLSLFHKSSCHEAMQAASFSRIELALAEGSPSTGPLSLVFGDSMVRLNERGDDGPLDDYVRFGGIALLLDRLFRSDVKGPARAEHFPAARPAPAAVTPRLSDVRPVQRESGQRSTARAVTESPSSVDFVVVTALEIERREVCKALGFVDDDRVKRETRVYWKGVLELANGEHYEVVVVQSLDMANVDAALVANDAIHHWRPESVLMVGIAGAVGANLDFGDVVVGSSVYYYERGKIVDGVAIPEPYMCSGDATLLANARALPDWQADFGVTRADGRLVHPSVTFGVVASGERVIAGEAARDEIASGQRKILAIDMEGYGVAKATYQTFDRVRHLVVRAISDKADAAKDDRWHRYAAASVASFIVHFLRDCPIPPRSRRVADAQQDAETPSASAVPAERVATLVRSDERIEEQMDRLVARVCDTTIDEALSNPHVVVASPSVTAKELELVRLQIERIDALHSGHESIEPAIAIAKRKKIVLLEGLVKRLKAEGRTAAARKLELEITDILGEGRLSMPLDEKVRRLRHLDAAIAELNESEPKS